MMPNMSERLARIETLLTRLLADVEKLSDAQNSDKAELAALKNKGAGILIGVGIVAGVVGAHVSDILKGIAAVFAGA